MRSQVPGIHFVNTIIEYRISEKHARSIFDRDEGKPIGGTLRLIKLDVDDPRWTALGRIYSRHRGEGFYSWRIERRYSPAETQDAKLHFFQIKTGVLPTGEECGTVYDDREMCPLCGAGRVQVSPLRLRLTNMPKKAEVAQTWGGESVVSDRVVQLMIASGITGFGLGPVQRSKKGDEEPFSLSETESGKKLLNAAERAGIPYPSPEFYVWINSLEQRKTLLSAITQHGNRKLAGRQLLGGTSSKWYQLFVTSNPVELAPMTRFGCGPFDDDHEGLYRCPLGLRDHVIGLNLLSQVTVQGTTWDGADIVRSRGLVGRRGGLFNPRHLLFTSPRLRNLLSENAVKGWTSEVATLS
jgi:hypothetical protein